MNSKCNYCKKNIKKCKCFVSDVIDDCIKDFKKRELKNINTNNMFKYIYCSDCDCTTFHLKTEDEEGWWFQCRNCKKKEITKKMENFKEIPNYYLGSKYKYEARKVIEEFQPDNYNVATAITYLLRAGKKKYVNNDFKASLEADIQKAINHLTFELERLK